MPNAERRVAARGVRIGPGLLITAAFIGPGTVVTASKAGARFGCELLWAIVFACLGTVVLQSLAARVGITERRGLGESIRHAFRGSHLLTPVVLLVIAAIGAGNAAYQTGNLAGAMTGVTAIAGGDPRVWLCLLVGLAATIIMIGNYRLLHAVLVGLVVLLSLAFLGTAMHSLPAIGTLASGILVPRVSAESLTLVLALIGTTIVPYNLFLHASSAASTWAAADRDHALAQSDWDTALSVGLGGMVTASILITAHSSFFATQEPWTGTDQIADQLEPTLGRASGVAFALGLFAAGLTSSITAPLATAYAVCGCLGWPSQTEGWRFRCIALSVVLSGGAIALVSGRSPTPMIIFAQFANGLLLPVAAVFLLIVARKSATESTQGFGDFRFLLAVVVVAAVAALGVWRIMTAL